MPNIKSLPTASPKIPVKSSLGKNKPGFFAYKGTRNNPPPHLTSIANRTGTTSAFHQFGDAISHTQSGQRSDKIYGSINSAIKNRRAPDSKIGGGKSGSGINSNLKPTIK